MPWHLRRMNGKGRRGSSSKFDFNSALATFTPGMAKRATSVFAASPIVQGKRDTTITADRIYSAVGNPVVGSFFYPLVDLNQGSICFRVTPEWNGNDGLRHDLVATNSGDILVFVMAGHLYNEGGAVFNMDVSGWVAGTTYNICLRWDYKNTLDGTNYCCISVNDVHTFGRTTPRSITASSYVYVGGNTAEYPPNAIIEGLTIYRRVLYDGTYGVNVQNGDEVALIAAGVDPCTITGSWDVCFALPTDATPGLLG